MLHCIMNYYRQHGNKLHVISMPILNQFSGQLCSVGFRTLLELFERIPSAFVRNQTLVHQLLYLVFEQMLSIIYMLVYELLDKELNILSRSPNIFRMTKSKRHI